VFPILLSSLKGVRTMAPQFVEVVNISTEVNSTLTASTSTVSSQKSNKPSWFQRRLQKIFPGKSMERRRIELAESRLPTPDRRRPLTKFKYFSRLPDELQVIIIKFTLAEPRAVIMERQYRLDRPLNLSFEGLCM
jgi:hypothetical protein